ncbi:uncharacterized protein LOC121856353 isoform X1 [Homarus americanus]|uniref:uncharacterized protein LOC121856353 isoform X1 n=2 Tax=Homarus americanus TaxID=6706 RepID=UPI001C4586EB|nr:uncharacterized protein LOC121856353 isoform X1 [Homarus americanus]
MLQTDLPGRSDIDEAQASGGSSIKEQESVHEEMVMAFSKLHLGKSEMEALISTLEISRLELEAKRRKKASLSQRLATQVNERKKEIERLIQKAREEGKRIMALLESTLRALCENQEDLDKLNMEAVNIRDNAHRVTVSCQLRCDLRRQLETVTRNVKELENKSAKVNEEVTKAKEKIKTAMERMKTAKCMLCADGKLQLKEVFDGYVALAASITDCVSISDEFLKVIVPEIEDLEWDTQPSDGYPEGPHVVPLAPTLTSEVEPTPTVCQVITSFPHVLGINATRPSTDRKHPTLLNAGQSDPTSTYGQSDPTLIINQRDPAPPSNSQRDTAVSPTTGQRESCPKVVCQKDPFSTVNSQRHSSSTVFGQGNPFTAIDQRHSTHPIVGHTYASEPRIFTSPTWDNLSLSLAKYAGDALDTADFQPHTCKPVDDDMSYEDSFTCCPDKGLIDTETVNDECQVTDSFDLNAHLLVTTSQSVVPELLPFTSLPDTTADISVVCERPFVTTASIPLLKPDSVPPLVPDQQDEPTSAAVSSYPQGKPSTTSVSSILKEHSVVTVPSAVQEQPVITTMPSVMMGTPVTTLPSVVQEHAINTTLPSVSLEQPTTTTLPSISPKISAAAVESPIPVEKQFTDVESTVTIAHSALGKERTHKTVPFGHVGDEATSTVQSLPEKQKVLTMVPVEHITRLPMKTTLSGADEPPVITTAPSRHVELLPAMSVMSGTKKQPTITMIPTRQMEQTTTMTTTSKIKEQPDISEQMELTAYLNGQPKLKKQSVVRSLSHVMKEQPGCISVPIIEHQHTALFELDGYPSRNRKTMVNVQTLLEDSVTAEPTDQSFIQDTTLNDPLARETDLTMIKEGSCTNRTKLTSTPVKHNDRSWQQNVDQVMTTAQVSQTTSPDDSVFVTLESEAIVAEGDANVTQGTKAYAEGDGNLPKESQGFPKSENVRKNERKRISVASRLSSNLFKCHPFVESRPHSLGPEFYDKSSVMLKSVSNLSCGSTQSQPSTCSTLPQCEHKYLPKIVEMEAEEIETTDSLVVKLNDIKFPRQEVPRTEINLPDFYNKSQAEGTSSAPYVDLKDPDLATGASTLKSRRVKLGDRKSLGDSYLLFPCARNAQTYHGVPKKPRRPYRISHGMNKLVRSEKIPEAPTTTTEEVRVTHLQLDNAEVPVSKSEQDQNVRK